MYVYKVLNMIPKAQGTALQQFKFLRIDFHRSLFVFLSMCQKIFENIRTTCVHKYDI